MSSLLEQLVSTVVSSKQRVKPSQDEDVITVSETVSAAASAYETMRNYLEYDEEHLFRRNAIRRILKRRFGEDDFKALSSDIIHELIWARYLPNKEIFVRTIDEVAAVLEKYQVLFDEISNLQESSSISLWLIDMLSTEIEYHLVPPLVNEQLALFAYQSLKQRVQWSATAMAKEDEDLALYIGVHRCIFKSNLPTLRYRIFLLYYPDWKTNPSSDFIKQIAKNLPLIHTTIERVVNHPLRDVVFRAVQRHAINYQILLDLIEKDPEGFFTLVSNQSAFEKEIKKAADHRYQQFYVRLRRSLVRAVIFLFFTKMILGVIIELPYDVFILKTTNYIPLLTNIFFHPFILAVIGLSVRIPTKANTEKITEEILSLLNIGGKPWVLLIKKRREWPRGFMGGVFHGIYLLLFALTITIISSILRALDFNFVSIFIFLFFLSLVLFFGLRLRGGRREMVIVETGSGAFSTLIDIFFLPIIRFGRFISLNAPRINIFLFFLDFIIEAPFKALIRLIEGWLAFLKEKKEDI
ncbi:hypothetical protein CO172_02510 [Candidatus Uhrbacteria bacterium CG_4_9_14_3_um_filter_36_7]|uniref:Uncharacterized protein n=1 Tax=Candidatus Uhrbacteria bacterium CG_4_9_14_3_um_filter_36_7 TaxID=1975033 RepID=A0A2M7XH80_9BACT|nr:MAG: hypothetical protein CO172_02510 [Candidatus Uhrbacteria bacterium CG_4_9_14_3_um_filter_36_7]